MPAKVKSQEPKLLLQFNLNDDFFVWLPSSLSDWKNVLSYTLSNMFQLLSPICSHLGHDH